MDDQFDNITRDYTPFAPMHDSDQLSYGNNATPEAEAYYLPASQELNFGG